MNEPASKVLTIAVFASDRGPGDPERSSLMTQAGTHFARRGARIVCLAEDGIVPVPLITAARAAGGNVLVISDQGTKLPPALSAVPCETLLERVDRKRRLVEEAQVLVALPGSLASIAALFAVWSVGRDNGRTIPVVMLNRHHAYEVLRGFAGDVLAHGLPGGEKAFQFSDTVEDLWTRASRLAGS